jgi:iron only hydrogenase large subunit-like protein
MSGFSAAVKIGDLDDFLSPAADCVILPAEPATKQPKGSVIKDKENVASITLSDCLACSGCVTSAETLLLQSQSVDELMTKPSKDTLICITVSSASRRALSAHLDIHPSKLCSFIESKLNSVLQPSRVVVIDSSTCEAIAVSETVKESRTRGSVLTSHCPGWTCYATKVLDESVLSLLSRIKSPEQIVGISVKELVRKASYRSSWRSIHVASIPSLHFIESTLSTPCLEIFHILISPCFDKKLEVIRPDYTVGTGEKGVDLVLSSTELLDLISKSTSRTESVKKTDVFDVLGLRDSWMVSRTDCESGGGYAQAGALEQSTSSHIEWKGGKNKDLFEFKTFMRSHGFRNIQNITRRIKSGTLADKQIVEVMACPGACVRGGGQPVETGAKMKKITSNAVTHVCPPEELRSARLLRSLLVEMAGSEDIFQSLISTEWKGIQLNADGVTVSSLKW